MSLRRRSTVPFMKWISGVCTNCGGHCSYNAASARPYEPHYCSICRNDMKEPDNDKE